MYKLTQENQRTLEGRDYLENLLDKYLVAKDRWKAQWGQPKRKTLKLDYQEIETELWYRLPPETWHRGFVIMKGHNGMGIYLQVFTEESYKKMKNANNFARKNK